MKQFNYADYESHKWKHDQSTQKVSEVKPRFDNGELVITLEITNFLKS